MIMDLFEILVIVILNVIIDMMLANIQTMKVVDVQRNYLINQSKNVTKKFKEMK